MEFFKIKRDIPFMSYGKLTTFISLITFIAAVFFLVTKGLNAVYAQQFIRIFFVEVYSHYACSLVEGLGSAATGLSERVSS